MKKQNNQRRQFVLLATIATIFLFGGSFSVRAQTAIKVFKVGDRVEMNVANDIQNDDRWIKGTVTEIIYTDDGRILSYKVKRDGEYVQQFGNLARVIRPLVGGGETNTTTEKEETKVQTDDADNSDADGDCSFEKYPALGSSNRFSEALVKSALYGSYSFETDTGGLSSPLAVGITFLKIQILNSYTNTVTIVPGRGAQRKHDGAPVGATIYRFHAKYIVCRKYSNATRRTQYESDNVCFKAKNGNWDCPVDSVPQITELK